MAWHRQSRDVASPKPKARQREHSSQPQPRLRGYQSVTVWLRELNGGGRATTTVELTDRNSWFRGVVEEKVLDAGR